MPGTSPRPPVTRPESTVLHSQQERRATSNKRRVPVGRRRSPSEMSTDSSRREEPWAALEASSSAETAPFPVCWVVAQARCDRVQHDVPNRVEEVRLRLDHARRVPRLEQMADVPVTLVEPSRVQAVQPVHPRREVGVREREDEMEVIRHQAVRETRPAAAIHRLSQKCHEHALVGVVGEDPIASNTSRSHMHRALDRLDARCTAHRAGRSAPAGNASRWPEARWADRTWQRAWHDVDG